MTDVAILWRRNPSCHLPSQSLSYLVHNVQGQRGKVLDGRGQFFVKPFSVTLFTRQPNTHWQKVSQDV